MPAPRACQPRCEPHPPSGPCASHDRLVAMAAADRVLVTSLPGAAFLPDLAARLAEAAIVVLASRESLYDARKECAAFAHVLIVEGARDEIPWADAWFDAILDPHPETPTPEMLRVLKPGGRILPLRAVGAGSATDCPQLD